jgi:hypothetical protein
MRSTAGLVAFAALVGCGAAAASAAASAAAKSLPQRSHKVAFGADRKRALERRAGRGDSQRSLQTANGGEWPQEHFDLLNR